MTEHAYFLSFAVCELLLRAYGAIRCVARLQFLKDTCRTAVPVMACIGHLECPTYGVQAAAERRATCTVTEARRHALSVIYQLAHCLPVRCSLY